MNPSHGNMIYGSCNPNFSWLSQPPPPLINYHQDQAFQYMNNNQNPTFPNNSLPFLAFHTLESTPYQPQETLEIPFSFPAPPPFPILNSILIPANSQVVVQVIGEVESGSHSLNNGVKELYIGSYGSAANDPYYSMRRRLICLFSPYLEVTGCWPDEQAQDNEAEVRSAGNNGKSRKKKNLFSCITWNSASTSDLPNPEPPIPKTSKNLKFLLMKELCGSDVNHLNRIILPKHEAESHLPMLVEKTGIKMLMRDVLLSVTWRMKFRFWYNSRSRIYVLEHTGDFVKKYKLKCGDVIALYQDETNQIYIYAKRNESSDSSSHQVITPPSQGEIDMAFPNPAGNNDLINVGEPSSAQQGSMHFNDLSYYLNQIEALLFDDEHDLTSTNYNNGLTVGEPSFSQEGFMNFNAVSTIGLINAEQTPLTREGLMNSNSVSQYLNERPDESLIFDENGLSRVDLRPGNRTIASSSNEYVVMRSVSVPQYR